MNEIKEGKFADIISKYKKREKSIYEMITEDDEVINKKEEEIAKFIVDKVG